jgi:hypothetical protein
MMTRPLLPALAFLLCLSACVPTGGSYLRAEHPDASYLQDSCYGSSGPALITFLPYHGAYLSLALHPYWRQAVFGIHLPAGHTAQLLEKEIAVAETRIALTPIRHGQRGNGAPYLFRSTDPMGKEDYFGSLTGDTQKVEFMIGSSQTAYKWYEFSAKPVTIPDSGTVVLPALRIDGTDYPALSLPFGKKSYVGISAFNC